MGQSKKFSQMKLIIILLSIIISSCAPVQQQEELETKYPEVPTMQSAEDANTGVLFKD